MPHYPKPFFRQSRGLWYVELRGKQINLGSDQEAAFQRYHELLAAPPEQIVFADNSPVVALCDNFLSWVEKHRAPDTYEWYQRLLQQFVSKYPDITVSQLKPYHVQQWIDEREVSQTSKRNCVSAIKRAMKWSKQQGYIKENPIADMSAPSAKTRDLVIGGQEYQQILDLIPDPAFEELVKVSWETGCRPQESLRVEARHFDSANKRWVFPKSESKGKKIARVVYLTDSAAAICERLERRHPTGPLFRNSQDKPWKVSAVNCAWRRVRLRLGKQIMKEKGIEIPDAEISKLMRKLNPQTRKGGKLREKTPAELRCEAKRKLVSKKATSFVEQFCMYTLRHSFCTRALLGGTDAITVSVLLGHEDTSTLAKTYQHLQKDSGYLHEQVNRIAS